MPQPIDPHTELGRTLAAERIQEISSRHQLTAQLRLTDDESEHQHVKERQAQETEERDEEMDRETRRRNPYVGRRKKKRDDGDPLHTGYGPDERATDLDDPDEHDFDVLA